MKRINSSDIVYEKLKVAFINDQLKYGQRIVEQELADQFGVSRTPLREAIKKLEYEGIIIRHNNGRLSIVDITEENINEIFKVRLAIENMLISEIANNKEILKQLEDNINNSFRYFNEGDIEKTREEIYSFTNIIYSAISLKTTENILKSYSSLVAKLRNKSIIKPEQVEKALNEHYQIYEALSENNIEKAVQINISHLQNGCQETIQNFLDDNKE